MPVPVCTCIIYFYLIYRYWNGIRTDNGMYFLMGHSRPLFFIFIFSIRLTVNKYSIKILPMTGFEPRTCGIRSDRSTTTIESLCLQNVWPGNCSILAAVLLPFDPENVEHNRVTFFGHRFTLAKSVSTSVCCYSHWL